MGVSPTESRCRYQLILVSLVLFISKCESQVHAHDKDYEIPNEINGDLKTFEDYGPNELLTNEKVAEISSVLANLLLVPWPEGVTPIVYIEKPDSGRENTKNEALDEIRLNGIEDEETMRPVSSKRSKYYRKYPWKRQQNSRYEPSYMCAPKKDDVYRLLVALHGERNGKRGQLVDFCNRKRPASLVFTNIRFVG